MNTKKFTMLGRHTVLPLAGDTLVEIRFGIRCLPELAFQAEEGEQSVLRIEDRIILKRGNSEQLLEGSKPGTTFDPKGLSPLLELLGSQVNSATAYNDGKLQVEFSFGLTLEITPSDAGEAWHFQYPRPGREYTDKVSQHLSLTGAPGHLIRFG